MVEPQSLQSVQQTVLKRSLYVLVAPIMLLLAALACGTILTEGAYYTCPTAVPPTDAPPPTDLPGTPVPTITPVPLPPTPFVIVPPQDFYRGDAVFVGVVDAPLRLRFRLQTITSQPAPPVNGEPRNLYQWSLEIKNLGSLNYETIPPALMSIIRLDTATGEVAGNWLSTEDAMTAAGLTHANYDPLTPNETRVYQLAAYAPAGSVRQLAYRLDDTGSNRITWVNSLNPFCNGDVAD